MARELTGSEAVISLLERLYRRHLFTDRRQGTERFYTFHALFRAFLQHRAETELTLAERVDLARRAAGLLERRGPVRRRDAALRLGRRLRRGRGAGATRGSGAHRPRPLESGRRLDRFLAPRARGRQPMVAALARNSADRRRPGIGARWSWSRPTRSRRKSTTNCARCYARRAWSRRTSSSIRCSLRSRRGSRSSSECSRPDSGSRTSKASCAP